MNGQDGLANDKTAGILVAIFSLSERLKNEHQCQNG
nr:MAG TPA: hypothetical protein [Herelleviridae sp.]